MRCPGISLASVESFVLLIMTVTWQTNGDCSGDVAGGTTLCLSEYKNKVTALLSSGQQFYSGVDVETIRMICGSLRQSALCAYQLKQSCPETEHSDIETLLSEHISIAHMCEFQNFFELYARNQFCFMKLSASSEQCYQSFRAKAESESTKIYTGDQSTLTTYCSFLDTFIECIKANVQINCAAEAVSLVEILVRPSVSMSEHCKNDTTTQQTPASTKKSSRKGDKETYAESKSRANNGPQIKIFLRTLVVLTTLALCR